MSNISWDNLMNTINSSWSKNLLGEINDNYLFNMDIKSIENGIDFNYGFKRKFNETVNSYDLNKFKKFKHN